MIKRNQTKLKKSNVLAASGAVMTIGDLKNYPMEPTIDVFMNMSNYINSEEFIQSIMQENYPSYTFNNLTIHCQIMTLKNSFIIVLIYLMNICIKVVQIR